MMAEGTSRNQSTVCPAYRYSSDDEPVNLLTQRFNSLPIPYIPHNADETRRYPPSSPSNLSFPYVQPNSAPEQIPCRYFQQGRCRFGDNCWNVHEPTPVLNAGPSRILEEPEPPPVDASHPADWLDAPEFVPKIRSYADMVKCNTIQERAVEPGDQLCRYFIFGDCCKENCAFIHGNLCDICNRNCLIPDDAVQNKAHRDMCASDMEREMELAFAYQRSIDKTCGICMDVVMEKEPITERRFGILEKCNHIFCLDCIRKWRKVKSFEGNNRQVDSSVDPGVTRACPECRVASDFITPSQYWVDNEEEKSRLIQEYKEALSRKPCKYFKKGKGTCPFGGACFYLHAKPDGTRVQLPPPERRRRQNQNGELDYMGRIFLWDYLELRDDNILMQLDLEDLMWVMSDSDNDDASETSENFFLSESF